MTSTNGVQRPREKPHWQIVVKWGGGRGRGPAGEPDREGPSPGGLWTPRALDVRLPSGWLGRARAMALQTVGVDHVTLGWRGRGESQRGATTRPEEPSERLDLRWGSDREQGRQGLWKMGRH